MESDQLSELEQIAARIRGTTVAMSHAGRAAHLGSCLSCVDILVSLYWQVLDVDPARCDARCRDRFILSKGHAAMALYATLAARGFFAEAKLATLNSDGGDLAEHPGCGCVPGVEAATGSLGHGLPIGVGMALAAEISGRPYRVFVLMSDGECNEGSVWEAAMFAAARRLNHLAIVVDYNKWQATGRSDEIMQLASLRDKWDSFGWEAVEVDGHSMSELTAAFARTPTDSGRPLAVVAHTVKGKGVSFMEDDNNWHYRIPTTDEVKQAHRELGLP